MLFSTFVLLDGTLLEDLKRSIPDMTEEEAEYIRKITPSHILTFFSDSAQVLVTGFNPDPTVSFVHDDTKRIPSSQTCFDKLYLFVDETVVIKW